MSRAALNRSLAVRARSGRLLEDPFDILLDYEPEDAHKAAALPIHGNARTLNMDGILATNIVQLRTFEQEVLSLSTPEAVWEEIIRTVHHVEPLKPGTARTPSEAFQLLFRLGVMRLTAKQLTSMVNHRTNAYVRAIGFLYLRYTCPPAELWPWFEPAIDDPAPFQPSGAARGGTVPFGEWLASLLSERRYSGTLLPRIPTTEERDIQVALVLARKDAERARAAERAGVPARLRPGTAVKARFSGDGKWYDATIDGPATERDTVNCGGKWWVTYPEFSDSELRSLGQIELPGAGAGAGAGSGADVGSRAAAGGAGFAGRGERSRSRSRSRERGHGRDDRDRVRDRDRDWDSARARDRSDRDVGRDRDYARPSSSAGGGGGADEVDAIRRQLAEASRAGAVASGRGGYAARVAGYKESMAVRTSEYNVTRLDAAGAGGAGAAAGAAGRLSRDRSRDRSRERSSAAGDRDRDGDRDRGRDRYDSRYDSRSDSRYDSRYDRRDDRRDDGRWERRDERPSSDRYDRYDRSDRYDRYDRREDRYEDRRDDRDRRDGRHDGRDGGRDRDVDVDRDRDGAGGAARPPAGAGSGSGGAGAAAPPPPSAEALARIKELQERYGHGNAAAAAAGAARGAPRLGVQDRDGEDVVRYSGWRDSALDI